MKSFKEVFEESEEEASTLDLEKDVFPSFRDNPGPYRFLTAVKSQYWDKDEEALTIAKSQDEDLFQCYVNKPKPLIGYSSEEKYVALDTIDSRHIMMNTMIFSHLGKTVGNVVEIGAGFGNWMRLNEDIIDFKSWTMIDLGFVSRLQEWYINQTVSNKELARYISIDRVDDLYIFEEWAKDADIDLIIGSHSLSEISIDMFKVYYETILPKTKYFFYATHKSQPSKSLVSLKLDMLSEMFDIVKQVDNQNGKCVNILYEIKK